MQLTGCLLTQLAEAAAILDIEQLHYLKIHSKITSSPVAV